VFFNSALANTVPSSSSACEASAIANARVDWKETPKAHVFKAILQGLKKGWFGKLLRTFRLPENAKMDQVKASMENGNLFLLIFADDKTRQEKEGSNWSQLSECAMDYFFAHREKIYMAWDLWPSSSRVEP
ncbi:hypothetical protein Goari_000273, partial [Gossypium aridum]|nr:hypothetical protein [Gossypium aridum]